MPYIRRSVFARFALLLACLLTGGVTSPVRAQDADTVLVRGRMVTAEGDPLPGAQVRFTPLDRPDTIPRIVTTTASGEFRIALPAGRYRWDAQRMGATSAAGEVQVAAGEMAMIVLAPVALASGSPFPGMAQSKYFNLSDVNYFSFGFEGSDDDRPEGESADQVKFRVALRYKIVNLFDIACDSCRTGVYAAYTQNSFWHFYDDSRPFFDNNYSPGLLVYYAFGVDGPDFRGLAAFAGLVHESNGRDEPESRGWQRTVAGATLGAVNQTRVSGTLSLWNPWGLEDTNPDLADYAGRGELTLFYQPHVRDGDAGPLTVQLRTRLFGSRLVNNVELNVIGDLPVGPWLIPQGFVQVFSGYAENLLTYQEKRTVVRIGLGLLR